MTTPEKENAGFPVWLLAVGAGGLVGIVAGALIFFGDSKPVADSDARPDPVVAQPSTGESISSAGGGGTLIAMPTTPEEWDRQIAEANDETFGALMNGALAIPDPAQRRETIHRLLARWLNTDISSYLDYMDDLEMSESGGAEAWPELVPAFLAALPGLSDDAATDEDLEETVLWMTEYYAEQDAPAALAWAKSTLLGTVQDEALATIAGSLALTSLDEAVAVARELKDPAARSDAFANIGAVLGERKPAEAFAWAMNLTDADERAVAMEEVFWSMSESDPDMAARELAKTNDPELLLSVGSTIAEELAAKDPARAVQWAAALPEGPARAESMAGALAGWAATDPEAAYAYLQANDRGNGDALEWVFEEWAAQKPEDAAAAVLQIPDAAARERAVSGLVYGWVYQEDTQAVEQWVDQLPAGRERDLASSAIVDALSFEEPEPAWERALTISDPQLRQEAVLSAFSGLAEMDADAARAALNSPELSEEDRQLLQPMVGDADGEAN